MPEVTQQQVVEYIKGISVLELSQLVKTLESELGVSAAAAMPMFAGAMPGAGGGAAAPAVVWIPRAAVREQEGRAVIYVVEGDRARERAISPRPLGPDRVSVSGGLAAGEAVVVEAPPELKDKSRIRIR